MHCQPHIKALVYKCLNINQFCLLCDEPAEQPYPLCVACECELPWLEEQCLRCALPMPLAGFVCSECNSRSPAFEQVVAPWHFGFPVDALISRFKHRGQWPMGRMLAQQLGMAVQHRYGEGLPRPHRLLPVPLARGRLRQRGFNQSAMIAQWLSTQLGIPCDEHVLRRIHDTPAQQTLGAKARQRNLQRAFSLVAGARIKGLSFALVDDVLTTGATAQALASLLLEGGAQRVDLYCLARTPKPAQG